jgi:hypothetical protein
MLAVGPPMSLTVPLKFLSCAKRSISPMMLCLAPRLDGSALMGSDRTEGTATKAAAHDRNRVFDHFERWVSFFVARVRLARVRKTIDAIHGLLRDRQLRRIDHDCLIAMPLI